MKKLLLTTFIYLSTSFLAYSSTKEHMNEVFQNYVQLYPYMYGNQQEDISQKVKKLEISFKKAKHGSLLKRANFQPIAKIFQNTLSEVSVAVDEQNVEYSKLRLRKAVSMCISCHSQLPAKSFPKVMNHYSKVTKKYIKTDYDKAMLAYFLRDYRNATKYFKKVYLSSDKKDTETLSKIIEIYVTNLNNRKEARDFLLSLNDLPQSTSFDVKEVIAKLNKPSPKRKIEKVLADLRDYKKELNIGLSNIVFTSDLRRELNNYIAANPKTNLMPEVLYSLGITHRNKEDIYLFSLSDLYFKRCILDYPKSNFANKCYKSYEESIYFGFTGSAGTNIPTSLKKELKELKDKIK